MTGHEVRDKFLRFFEQRDHRVVASAGLVPQDDPTLLFVNAGMVPFKEVFLGHSRREYVRAASSQKCLRVSGKHNDLESVGRTARHHTFFEMLGNFSFGDYFKLGAIEMGWEFVTEALKLDAAKLWVTVFCEDEEAYEIWNNNIHVPAARIVRMDEKDNFWSMGETGPCGPCSEIHIDQGPAVGCGRAACDVACECDRYLELWNLVFMQYDRGADGALNPLPKPSVDTGMGLERLSAVLQGVTSNFECDLLMPIISHVGEFADVTYGDVEQQDVALRVIADHGRAIAFLITDGVMPANEGRGYVLRRLLRRAARYGKQLGFDEPFLYRVIGEVVDLMGVVYPDLTERRDYLARLTLNEEERFITTLEYGLQQLQEMYNHGRLWNSKYSKEPRTFSETLNMKQEVNKFIALRPDDPEDTKTVQELEKAVSVWEELLGPTTSSIHEVTEIPDPVSKAIENVRNLFITISGTQAFKLHDTYGFPLDLTRDSTSEEGFKLNESGFQRAMEEQRQKARASWSGGKAERVGWLYEDLYSGGGDTPFVGHEKTKAQAWVEGILTENGNTSHAQAATGQVVELWLSRTPCYPESGGQVGDVATLRTAKGTLATITDTQYAFEGGIIHHARIERGVLEKGTFVEIEVDRERRNAIRRNHSATHLMHAALKQVLGDHVKQAGSLVAPDRLRFDFTHFAALTPRERDRVEELVNAKVLENLPISTAEMPIDDAIERGAMALFGEKYGAEVRVVQMSDFSLELCGGTHLNATGEVGFFNLISESAVAAGVRRIEAVTGEGAYRFVKEMSRNLSEIGQLMKAAPFEEAERVRRLVEHARDLEKELARLKSKAASEQSTNLLDQKRDIDGVQVLSVKVENVDVKALRSFVDESKDKLKPAIVVAGTVIDGKIALVAGVTKDLTKRFSAGDIVKNIALTVGGSGGGRPDMAQAGGKDVAKLDEALERVYGLVQSLADQQ